MDFYARFVKICKEHGVSPSKAATEAGISKPTVTGWKVRGSTPTPYTLEKISDYFGISTDYLLEDKEQKNAPATQTGSESEVDMKLREFAMSASPEELQELNNYIEFIKSKRK